MFGTPKGAGGGRSGAAATRRREEAKERQAEQEQQVHDRELARQEPIKEKIADEKDVVLGNPRWSVERAFFTQKVRASVDVAIPNARAGVTKVTFTLFAILPNGKRSKQILTAEGHPDSKGTATVEVVLHYPDSDERVIVKPVESYDYFFIAKHKYSKEIAGPEIQVIDHIPSLYTPTGDPFDIQLPIGNGDFFGGILPYYLTHPTEPHGGLRISIEFRNRKHQNREMFSKYRWKQIIWTDDPDEIRKSPFADIIPGGGLSKEEEREGWYGVPAERDYQKPLFKIIDGDYFTDEPHRPFHKKVSYYWKAQLTLFGINHESKPIKIASIKYGYILNPDKSIELIQPVLVK
jgi:hypothetical protein